jgi:2-dehydropantoate 2-reductase
MSIVVVGGGAIGLLTAARLAQQPAGPPSALLARPRSAAALTAAPLQISGLWAGSVPQLLVAGSPADLPAALQQPRLAILAVKGYDTPAAVETLRQLAPQTILTLQNGIGNEETLAAAFGAARIIAGAITTSVDAQSATQISVTKLGGIGLASVAGADLQFAQQSLQQAGFQVATFADYRAMKWSKALLNMLGNATAAILDWPVERVYADRRLIALECAALREALNVMDRLQLRPINLPRYPAALLAFGLRRLPTALFYPLLRSRVAGGRGGKAPSLLRDLQAGRDRSEGEFLYGAVAAAAASCGLAAPVNAALWRILGGIARTELRWDDFRGRPAELLRACGEPK